MNTRRVQARFTEVTPESRDGGVGVRLCFQPERSRLIKGPIDDYADLGPALTVPAVSGVGKVLRILRAGRVAAPAEPFDLVGCHEQAAALLSRVLGISLRLELRPRVRVRFVAWTEHGVEEVDDVADVHEFEDAYYVSRHQGRFPIRFDRSTLARHVTESHRWHEVIDIERA